MKLSEIARVLGCELRGDGDVEITDVAPIEDAPPGTLTFVADRRHAHGLAGSRAAAVLLPPDAPDVPLPSLRSPEPYAAFVAAVELFHRPWRPEPGVHPTAVVAATAKDDVEIGANATVDRATLGATVVGRGTKIDNLVMVGHGCRIGPHCLIAGQVGLAGSTTLGARVMLGGQAGSAGHLTVGDGARIAAQSGVPRDLPAGGEYAGYPAVEAREWRRVSASLPRLPDLLRRVRRVERALGIGA